MYVGKMQLLPKRSVLPTWVDAKKIQGHSLKTFQKEKSLQKRKLVFEIFTDFQGLFGNTAIGSSIL